MELLVPVMTPSPGARARRFVGDRIAFELKDAQNRAPARGWRALLRTNLGRARELRTEILHAHAKGVPFAGNSWRDIPMDHTPEGWKLDLPLAEPGFFKAKAYLLDPRGWQHWPDGADFGLSVHPNFTRTANTIYCAFPRMFGASHTAHAGSGAVIKTLDDHGYAVIPPSGKLRDLTRELPHIVHRLGCRIVHLLPVNPTPTTYARFGRYGSPYASLDLSAVDPSLVVFDKKTTGEDQFRELAYAAHSLGARVFLDIVVNHTGWGSRFQETHPEWFLRTPEGEFKSPGAWGTTWEDLVELKHQNVELWDELSKVFLAWCERGVDGFRCDAGYMVPMPAWQYITARVQQEHPNTIFLLEGLGGAWELTEALLTEGGMQWAYSELFQNYSGVGLARYMDHGIAKTRDVGLLIHYSETHDNDRLAAKGREWSLHRNRLCALASENGGFGFTCGVEWLAAEKIRVHGRTSLNKESRENIVEELAALNRLISTHPCFFDGARVSRISREESNILALSRVASDEQTSVLVLANTDFKQPRSVTLRREDLPFSLRGEPDKLARSWKELLGQPMPEFAQASDGVQLTLPPGAVYCLGAPYDSTSAEEYRNERAAAAWALEALCHVLPIENIGTMPWKDLAKRVNESPARFLGAVSALNPQAARRDLGAALASAQSGYLPVIEWELGDARRITPVPPKHWLLVRHPTAFRMRLCVTGQADLNLESTPTTQGHIASVPPRDAPCDGAIHLEHDSKGMVPRGLVRFLPAEPASGQLSREPRSEDAALLTNGRGGMASIALDLGRINSKYDCVLAANLHPELPVDRHVLAKRIRVWVNADGFISQLDGHTLAAFEAGPPATWRFVAPAGDGRTVEVQMQASMLLGQNVTAFRFSRPTSARASGKQLPTSSDVRLTIRFDIEDRNFHGETHRNSGAEHHFGSNTRGIPNGGSGSHEGAGKWRGFAFTPAEDRQLHVYTDAGCYHPDAEWSTGIAHPVEQSRGQVGHGDAYSPGWFELPLPKGGSGTVIASAEKQQPQKADVEALFSASPAISRQTEDTFESTLLSAADAFLVRRGEGKTVIAGYPWFLDWGRDTFIAARGYITAGKQKEVTEIVRTFARFEQSGTLPNTIFGEDASNRDTSDAPLWFGLVCEELTESAPGTDLLSQMADKSRTIRDVAESIAEHYSKGTPNGIRMDPSSGLIWSPSHFTWMDTNYPAATPREGYPVEIQALWVRLLRFLARQGSPVKRGQWKEMAELAEKSIEALFWLEDKGWYSDVLIAQAGVSASKAVADDALRSNACFLVSLGLSSGERARSTAKAAARHLLVPGALRSLAPLPVRVPLEVRSASGHLLNDPRAPYWGRYEGDEDTRRKPAYHNGTAWVWTLPTFCEALARSWDFSPESVSAAKACLLSTEALLREGCIGNLPEIVDGDAPHHQRGCNAQAWSVTETLRVWSLLKRH